MKLQINHQKSGFTLMETLFAVILFGITSSAVLSGVAFGMKQVGYCRDSLGATQVLVEKTETIRLYTLAQVRDTNYFPRAGKQGIYHIRTEVLPVPWANSYSTNVSLVRITVNWDSFSVPCTRTWETYVSQSGLQTYGF